MKNRYKHNAAKPILIDVSKGSNAYRKLTKGYDVCTLWWPARDRFYRQIERTQTQVLRYPELFAEQIPDLRPYLLALLYQNKISIQTFNCLHILTQIKDSGYTNITSTALAENISLLQLSDDKAEQLKAQLTEEDCLFKISVNAQEVAEQLLYAVRSIIEELNNPDTFDKADISYARIKYLMQQFCNHDENYRILFIKNIQNFFDSFNDKSEDDDEIEAVMSLLYGLGDRLMNEFNLSCSAEIYSSLVHIIHGNGLSPILTYHHDANLGWFFIFLPQATLDKYIEVKTNQEVEVSMEWVYRPITALQMKSAKLRDTRLGSITPFGVADFGFAHDLKMPDSSTNTRHDIYHYLINAHMKSELRTLTNYWLNLLEAETEVVLSYYSWRLTDCDLPFCLRINGSKGQLKKSFATVLPQIFHKKILESHEGCLIVADMIVNQEKKPWRYYKIKYFIPDILEDIAFIKIINACYQATQSLTETVAAYYLIKNHVPIELLTDVNWKKDSFPYKNSMSLYLGDISLRKTIEVHQKNKQDNMTVSRINQAWNRVGHKADQTETNINQDLRKTDVNSWLH